MKTTLVRHKEKIKLGEKLSEKKSPISAINVRKILLIASILIVVAGLGVVGYVEKDAIVGLYNKVMNRNTNSSADNSPVVITSPDGAAISKESNDLIKDGNGVSNDIISIGDTNPSGTLPLIPSIDQLNKKFEEVYTAVNQRDYTTYKSLSSSFNEWVIENAKISAGTTENGTQIFYAVSPNGEADFTTRGNSNILFDAPLFSDLTPVSVEQQTVPSKESTGPDDFFYFVQLDRKTVEKVRLVDWQHRLILNYAIKNNPRYVGTGKIYFVPENGEWKFYYSIWDTIYSENAIFGDDSCLSNTYTEITPDSIKNETEIQAGTCVRWTGFEGTIQAKYGTTTDLWNSEVMQKGAYEKLFSTPGTYEYQIVGYSRDLIEAKIIVK